MAENINEKNYVELTPAGGAPIRAWVKGVPFDPESEKQLRNAAHLPFIFRWIAAMPDVHLGIGATVGSVIPTKGAIIPAAVGVDIGCGMAAVRTSLGASDLPDDLKPLRTAIETAVPHGRTDRGRANDAGAWQDAPRRYRERWALLEPSYQRIVKRHGTISRNTHPLAHLGTLGTGNHFIEICLDESDRVWVMLHSGSRGVGNRIGTFFIEQAQKDMRAVISNLPDRDLAYLQEGTRHFDEYVEAVDWAQSYALANRELMMAAILEAVRSTRRIPPFTTTGEVVNCHHNYVAREVHFGEEVFVTRKGAVRAGLGDLGIIPGSMGTRSYIVRGLGNPDSFMSCSHGAGRNMSRNEARRRFTLADHEAATAGIECRKDAAVIDETPAAYKPIEAVMAAQNDLVEIVHTLHQVVCVKG
ncbi:MAG TPA: RtcB family protein [Candidatus Binataceae bacterium]|nr:RtcB family protein [Candidatus Binataceae bacterium]